LKEHHTKNQDNGGQKRDRRKETSLTANILQLFCQLVVVLLQSMEIPAYLRKISDNGLKYAQEMRA
jgi:hypothetical protein